MFIIIRVIYFISFLFFIFLGGNSMLPKFQFFNLDLWGLTFFVVMGFLLYYHGYSRNVKNHGTLREKEKKLVEELLKLRKEG